MKNLVRSIKAMITFTVLTGVLYPLSVTLVSKVLLANKADGGLVRHNGEVVGAELIGQNFSQGKYFWPRPSATKYDPASSGASNLGLTSADLIKSVKEREAQGFVAEMRFASGSGLDPHISPAAARSQTQRVAEARHLSNDQKKTLQLIVEAETEERQLGFLGEPRVNVLMLNLKLDEQFGR